MDEYEAQYNKWFTQQSPELREPVFQWNVENFLRLINKNQITFKTLLEIGGAEGTNIDILKKNLSFKFQATNCDIGAEALKACKKRYPYIKILKHDVTQKPLKKKFDVLLLSDIIEHIADDNAFLNGISKQAKYALIKLPIEKVFWNKISELLGRKPRIGPNHPSGHLHEYTSSSGLKIIEKYFTVIDKHYSTMIEGNNLRAKIQKIIKMISPAIYFRFFGGSLYVLAIRKN